MELTPGQNLASASPDPQQLETTPEAFSANIDSLPPAPPVSRARRIFMGPFGLRAGWSLIIYFSLIAGCIFTVRGVHHEMVAREKAAAAAHRSTGAPIAAKPDPNAPQPVREGLTIEAISFGIPLMATLAMAFIEKRRFGSFGLGGTNSLSRFFTGSCWGLAALSLLVGTLYVFHLVSFDTMLDHGWSILGWGGAQLVGFLLVGLGEEFLFRGYLQFTLTRGLVSLGNLISRNHARAIGFWMAATITSALFFFAHTGNTGETKVGLLLVFLAGMVFVVALWRTGSLWWAIGFHMAWDWAQSFLYGVPDSGQLVQGRLFVTHAMGNPVLSGGTDGPEGSVFCIPVLLLVLVVLLFTRSSPQPELEIAKPG